MVGLCCELLAEVVIIIIIIITRLMTHVKVVHRVKNRKCGWSRISESKLRVAVVESPVDHWAGDRLCGVGWDVLPNVTQRPQVEVGRLANAVDMFIEWQCIINSHSQTSDASRKLDANALKVECAWRTFRSLSRAGEIASLVCYYLCNFGYSVSAEICMSHWLTLECIRLMSAKTTLKCFSDGLTQWNCQLRLW